MESIACAVEGLKHKFWSDVLEHTGTLECDAHFAACIRQTETDTPCGQLLREQFQHFCAGDIHQIDRASVHDEPLAIGLSADEFTDSGLEVSSIEKYD